MIHYNNRLVRRQDRLLSEDDAMTILMEGEYGILSMVLEENSGYGIPMSYVFENEHIYFHCAQEGEKLRALAQNNRVSFCVVGKTKVIPNQFSTAYESVLAKGTIALDIPDEEKMHALELILDKYAPDYKETGLKYAEKSFRRTKVIRMDISSVTGKGKILK